MLLQQQYRERKFKKYSELISCLLLAEQNNELLLRNHQSRPTGSISFPEVNGTRFTSFPEVNGASFQRKRGRGRGRKNYGSGGPRSDHTKRDNNRYTPYHQKWFNSEKGKDKQLVDLYQSSIKEKTKKFETNFTKPSYALDSIDGEDITSLDVSDFFEDSSGRVDHESVPF
ncbi:hypothetical protein I3760_06G094900 [Carya illinoinensis]|nr:hypothetical protein I3760_06G094900 [Carya illinoinensis]